MVEVHGLSYQCIKFCRRKSFILNVRDNCSKRFASPTLPLIAKDSAVFHYAMVSSYICVLPPFSWSSFDR